MFKSRIQSNGFPIGRVNLHGKFGFIDCDGELVIPPDFDQLFSFSETLCGFLSNGKLGFIDCCGAVVIPAEFELASMLEPRFSEGICAVRKAGKVGYINNSGAFVIPPRYAFGGSFLAGYAIVLHDEPDVGYCLIHARGEVVTIFDAYEVDLRLKDLNFIRCTFRINVDQELLDGFMDREGKVTVRAQHRFVENFSEGLAQFSNEETGPYGFLNQEGVVVVEQRFLNGGSEFVDGLAPASIDRTHAGFIDCTGELKIPAVFEKVWSFSEGLAKVRMNGKFGFVNTLGDVAIPPTFDKAGTFRDGHVAVEYQGRQAYVNRTGRVIWQNPL